jgi:hypothetical protein
MGVEVVIYNQQGIALRYEPATHLNMNDSIRSSFYDRFPVLAWNENYAFGRLVLTAPV